MQKNKMDKEMDEAIEKYDSALVGCRKVLELEKDTYILDIRLAEKELGKERHMWLSLKTQSRMQIVKAQVAVSEEKRKHRDNIQQQLKNTMDAERTLKKCREELENTEDRLDYANWKHDRESRDSKRKYHRLNVRANKASDTNKRLKADNDELHEKLTDVQYENDRHRDLMVQYRKECEESLILRKVARADGGRGGLQWERRVVQIIVELLVIGVKPTQIRKSMAVLYEHLYHRESEDLPSVDFIRKQRTVVQVIIDIISAIRLGRAKKVGSIVW